MNTYINLFMAFFRPGIFGFGGGPAAIPLIQKEVIDKFGWLTIEEYADTVALGNTLPGPIATKLAAIIGYKVAGVLGALITLVAVVVPTAVAAALLYQFYAKYKDQQWLKSMMIGVRPVVVVLLAESVFSIGQKAFPMSITWGILLAAAAGLFYFKVHPAILIVASMLFGIAVIR